jgi:hypothetical protein
LEEAALSRPLDVSARRDEPACRGSHSGRAVSDCDTRRTGSAAPLHASWSRIESPRGGSGVAQPFQDIRSMSLRSMSLAEE